MAIYYITIAILLICFIFGSLFNLIVIIVYIKYYKSYLSILILTVLSMVNFISSFVLVPIELLVYIEWYPSGEIECTINYFFQYFINTESLLLLVVISFERYQNILSITLESKKKNHFLIFKIKHRAKIILLFTFICSFAIGLLSFLFHSYQNGDSCLERETTLSLKLTLSIGIIFVFIVTSFMYLKIYLVVRTSSMKVVDSLSPYTISNFTTFNVNNKNGTLNHNLYSNNLYSSSSKKIRKDWKAAKIFILVFLNEFLQHL